VIERGRLPRTSTAHAETSTGKVQKHGLREGGGGGPKEQLAGPVGQAPIWKEGDL
jgi:hypothetical protein